MTTKIEFTPEEIDALEYERYHHPHPKVQRKMESLYLKSQGLEHQEIQRLCRISSKTTLTTYLKQYQEGGIEGLKQLNYPGQVSELLGYAPSLEEEFKTRPPRSTSQAQATIEKLTGVKRSPTQIREFMKRLGLRCRKVGYVPGKATTPEKQAEQQAFKTQQLEPRLAEAKAGQRVVLFMDAAHFVHQVFLGFVWCFTRLFIPSPSGRKRFNVLGAVDAVTKEIHILTNETYINSATVCRFLVQIAQHYQANIPITIVLDNARYQKCYLVQACAAALDIELLYLPSYSPNLNLIERLWRFVKKECLYSTYYPTFTEFKQTIDSFIQTAHLKHKAELETLLSWNFQSFEKVQISAV
jgi:transposase